MSLLRTSSLMWKILLTFNFIGIFCYFRIKNNQNISVQPDDLKNKKPGNLSVSSSTTWITMALCWSGNVQILGKNKFPYREAVPLSTQLWHKFTPAKVIVQIVYSDAEVPPDLEIYKYDLEKLGATVFLVPTGEEITCVLKSQLIRLLAYNFPFIQDNDIIVTADVDAFVMTKDIYKPLTLPREIYLYRYANTLDSGITFNMPFIGIKASVWRGMFKTYDLSQDRPKKGLVGNGLPKMVEYYRQKLNISKDNNNWYIDQDVFSHEILSTGLCSLPKNHILWKRLKIDPSLPREFDDRKTCWHGPAIYEDCNNASFERNMKLRYHGGNCKWWHFTPDERYPALKSKFEEIINGKSESPLVKTMEAAKLLLQRMKIE